MTTWPSVEECERWILKAADVFFHSLESYEQNAPWREVWGTTCRYSDVMREQAEHHIVEAYHFRGDGNLVRMRYHLVQWRLCRAAAAAIERERGR